MNRSITAYAVVIALAGFAASAQADDITIDTTPFVATATRAQVLAELQAFQRAGVNPWSISHNPLAGFSSSKTRAQVAAEYQGARDEAAALTAEDSGSAWLAARTPLQVEAVLAGQPVSAQ